MRETLTIFFYMKRYKSIGVPTLIFSGLYTVYNFFVEIFLKDSGSTADFLGPICKLLVGEPYYHMWYLFMLLGVYALVSVVLRVKADVGEELFARLAVAFFIVACPSGWTIAGTLFKWNIGYSFCFLGYFMIGYIIRKWADDKKSKGKGLFYLFCGVGILLIIGLLRYEQGVQKIADSELTYSLVGPFNPLVVLASVLIFPGFP